MKGKIFVAWSGNNHLASAVAKQLATKEYAGVVGGESGTNSTIYVGDAVMREINQCNQAIFIVEIKDKSGISGNLLFELGYALSRFNGNKIHVFYIDIEKGSPLIPSDLDGIWANYIKFENLEKTSEKVVKLFLDNQKTIIPEEKMTIVDSYYTMKSKIPGYSSSPFCSEYEFAQYILFFTLSAYMFQCEEDTMATFKTLYNGLKNPATELQQALTFGMCYMRLFAAIKKEQESIYIERSLFREELACLKKLEDDVSKWDTVDNDFQLWFLTMINDTINYMHILYSYCPSISPEMRAQILRNSLEYAERCLKYCSQLSGKPENEQCVRLFNAYMYRNLSIAYSKLAELDSSEEYRLLGIDNLKSSLDERQKLWWNYKNYNINTKLFENFEMEYYLALSEYMPYVDDPMEREEMKLDCREYVKGMDQVYQERNFFMNKIKAMVE